MPDKKHKPRQGKNARKRQEMRRFPDLGRIFGVILAQFA
jgi:hypothetical protein